MHKGSTIDTCNGYKIINCIHCGFVHIDPVPSQKELDTIYKDKYYSVEKPRYLERAKEDLEWWNLSYSDRYDTFEEQLHPWSRRILDIGSGPGYFLLHGKNRGWETLGIEPSTQAADYSRSLGLNVINDFFNEHSAKDIGEFDVVHMSEVLEHIPSPADLVQLVYRILKPGGVLCALVPNEYSHFQNALRNSCDYEPWWLAPPHHINYFDLDSVTRLFMNNGFDVILSEATFPIDMFLLMGDNYVGNDETGRLCHSKRKSLEMNLASAGLTHVKRQLYQKFADIGIGREIIVYARKH